MQASPASQAEVTCKHPYLFLLYGCACAYAYACAWTVTVGEGQLGWIETTIIF